MKASTYRIAGIAVASALAGICWVAVNRSRPSCAGLEDGRPATPVGNELTLGNAQVALADQITARAALETQTPLPSNSPVQGELLLIEDGGDGQKEIGSRVDGRREGTWRTFKADGRLWLEAEYEQGMLHGLMRMYGRNRVLRMETEYTRGVPDGYLIWHESGTVAVEAAYENGRRTGRYLEWYENGSPKADCLYKNNLLEGACHYWHESGEVDSKKTGYYVAGVKKNEL